jgi:hypothetical protein
MRYFQAAKNATRGSTPEWSMAIGLKSGGWSP